MLDSMPARRWVHRAEGDRRVQARLSLDGREGAVLLNDRRIPGSKETIELIAVSPAGVFVIDTKRLRGLVHTRRSGTIGNLGPHELHVGRRDCTRWVEAVHRRSELIRASLEGEPCARGARVQAMLCLTRAEWGFASAVRIGEVWVGWPRLVAGEVHAPGDLDHLAVQDLSARLADVLPVV